MRRVYQITGAVFLLVAAFLGYHAVGLRYNTPLGPGPGFFPVWLSLLLGLLGIGVLLRASLARPEPLPEDFIAPRSGYARMAAVLVALLAVPLVMPVLGFRLTMLGFYLALLSVLGRRHPVETAILSLLGSFGVYHVFVELLSQPLPLGSLGF